MKKHIAAPFSVLFWIAAVAFIALLVYYIKVGMDAKTSETDDTELNVKWRLSNNVEIDPEDRTFYSVAVENNVFSIYHESEEALPDARLAFNTFFVDAEVFLNDNLVFSTKDESDPQSNGLFNLDAPPPKLHFVDFDRISKGDIIRIDISLYYNDGFDGISGLVYGEADIVSGTVESNEYLGFFLSAVLFAFGIIMLAVRLASRKNVLTSGLEYIAFFAFFSTFFSLLQTSLFSTEIGFPSDVTYILHCLTFLVMFLPLILFFAESMTLRASKTFLLFDSVFQFLCIGASAALAATGTADFHTTHFYAEIIGIGQFLLILIMLIVDFAKKTERWNSDLTLLVIYALFLAIATVEQFADLGGDIPVLWLAACLFLILAVAVVKTRSASEQLKSVTETEKIGKLAYEDGLTGVGNTAAFRKKLSHLEVVKINYKTIGIVQFDINNLKTINDTLGHEMGDKLITDGSSMISRIFGKIGDVYRTGGDEFVAIICGDKAASQCDGAIADFERAMDEYNSDDSHSFMLQVAYGVDYYRSDTDKRYTSLRQIQKLADEKMYEKKREMKAAAKASIAENAVIRTD